jgi:hypothetical protein
MKKNVVGPQSFDEKKWLIYSFILYASLNINIFYASLFSSTVYILMTFLYHHFMLASTAYLLKFFFYIIFASSFRPSEIVYIALGIESNYFK